MPTKPCVIGDMEQLTEPMSPEHLIRTTRGMYPYRVWCSNEIDKLNRNPFRRTFLLTDKKDRICIAERLINGQYLWKLAEREWKNEATT